MIEPLTEQQAKVAQHNQLANGLTHLSEQLATLIGFAMLACGLLALIAALLWFR